MRNSSSRSHYLTSSPGLFFIFCQRLSGRFQFVTSVSFLSIGGADSSGSWPELLRHRPFVSSEVVLFVPDTFLRPLTKGGEDKVGKTRESRGLPRRCQGGGGGVSEVRARTMEALSGFFVLARTPEITHHPLLPTDHFFCPLILFWVDPKKTWVGGVKWHLCHQRSRPSDL